jgi:uncharacterized membrane protein YcaP (DUF421 family)
LLVLVRVSGRRTVGQFTPFDLLVVMLLSESVSNALNGDEKSVTGGLLAAATLVALNIGIAFLTSRSARARDMVEGNPVLIGRNGNFLLDVLQAHRIPLTDALQALREADCELKDMKAAVLETDGQISILKDSTCSSDDLRAKPGRKDQA